MPKPPIRKVKKKVCQFCKDKATYVDYKDTTLLRKFISDRGKIRARRVTGNCTQHQRDVATAKVTKASRGEGGGGFSGGGGGGGFGSSGGGGGSSDPWSTPAGPSDEPPF